MARYIDADWIYQMVENRYRVSSGIEHRCERDLLDLICEAPTADVAPTSEVDALEDEVDKLKTILGFYALKYGTVQSQQKVIDQAKSEVAREIFEEIDEAMIDHARGDIDNHWLYVRIAELKKKYTEEK